MAEQDMKQANQSYESFTHLIKWSSLVVIIAVAIVILLIAN